MDLQTLLLTMLRRWYVVVPILVLTAFGAVRYTNGIEPEYRASGSILILGPSRDVEVRNVDGVRREEVITRNPYTNLSAALRSTAIVLVESVDRGTFRTELAAQGLSSDITMTVGESVPLILVEGVADSEKRAVDTVNATLFGIAAELQSRQDTVGAGEFDRFTTEIIGNADSATELAGARDRALGASIVLGLGVAVGAALLVDNMGPDARRRRRWRYESGGPIGQLEGQIYDPGLVQAYRAGMPPALPWVPPAQPQTHPDYDDGGPTAIDTLARANEEARLTLEKLFAESSGTSNNGRSTPGVKGGSGP